MWALRNRKFVFFQAPKGLLFTTAEQQKISSTEKLSFTEKLTTTTKITTTASQITTTKISTSLVTTSTHHIKFPQEKINYENKTWKIEMKNSSFTSSDFSFDIPGYVYRIGSKIEAIRV